MILFIGMPIISGFSGSGPGTLKITSASFVTWDNPGPYFLTYITGYAIVWWKPLWGSIIIMAASICYVLIAGLKGPPVFAVPGFLVGALYMAYWLNEGNFRKVPGNE